jgi:phosphoglycerate kinase
VRSIDELDVQGRRVLVRVDFNVPLREEAGGGRVVDDDTRIRAALETVEELRRRGARLVLVSHLGRPERAADERFSMAPVAERLRELTGAEVALAPGVVGPAVRARAEALADGEILLLENVRFEPGEKSNDPAFAAAPTPTSTTPSAWRTARTRAPRASRGACRAPPDGCSNASCAR